MPRRSAILVLLIVALVSIPALCLGGVLAHACGDGHEDDCAADPCSALIRPDGADEPLAGSAADLALAVLPAPLRPFARAVPPSRAAGPWVRARSTALAYHQSDVPLRI